MWNPRNFPISMSEYQPIYIFLDFYFNAGCFRKVTTSILNNHLTIYLYHPFCGNFLKDLCDKNYNVYITDTRSILGICIQCKTFSQFEKNTQARILQSCCSVQKFCLRHNFRNILINENISDRIQYVVIANEIENVEPGLLNISLTGRTLLSIFDFFKSQSYKKGVGF